MHQAAELLNVDPQDLEQVLTDVHHSGSRNLMSEFDASAADDQNEPVVRPLVDAVLDWYGADQQEQARATWSNHLSAEPGADALSHFLDKLRTTMHYANSTTREPFSQGVRELLDDMANSPLLRQDCIAICTEATESCEDRVTLSYQKMAVPRLSEAVRRGDFDDNDALPGFIDHARSLYRRDVLTDIANHQVAITPRVDAIEVHLAFQVELNAPLQLALNVRGMRFSSHLTQAHFQQAKEEVQQRENEGFANHLINHSGPWSQFLERRSPELHEQMQEAKHEALNDLPEALAADLAERNLPADDLDAQRHAGRLVTDALTTRAQRPLVEQFLREHDNDPDVLLGPKWPAR